MKSHISALAVVTSLLVPAAAFACINAVAMDGDEAVALMERAKDKLESGDFKGVLIALEDVEFSEPNMTLTAETLIETARLRQARKNSASDVTTARAVKIFSAIQRERSNPLIKTRLAEALALSSTEADQLKGHGILESLNKADLIPDAYGYAVLAYLRRLAGEEKAAAKALSRCRTMTKYKKTGCSLPRTFKVAKVNRRGS
jgi:hypothetical protein